MNSQILREIGLTEGEIKVYTSLIALGKSSTGKIMEKSGISSSKVYLILEKLIQKGLVSFILENNVKKFQVANPKNIIEYINKQQKELESIKKQSEEIVKEITSTLGKFEEESAQIYRGFAGMRAAFDNLLAELDKGNEFLFFSQSKEELENEKVRDFFKNLHAKRLEKNILTRGIVSSDLEELFKKNFIKQKNYQIAFYKITMPMAVSIGKNRILFNIWGDNPICFEIISKNIADKHRNFFNQLWKLAKK